MQHNNATHTHARTSRITHTHAVTLSFLPLLFVAASHIEHRRYRLPSKGFSCPASPVSLAYNALMLVFKDYALSFNFTLNK
jgi:hypothetical protein